MPAEGPPSNPATGMPEGDASAAGELAELRRQLAEANEALAAIQGGEVDAIVVRRGPGNELYTLEGAERPYRLFVEEMSQGALTLGADGSVLYCNRRFAAMLQWEPGGLLGSRFEAHLSPAGASAWRTLLAGAGGARTAGEIELLRQDGTVLPAFATLSTLKVPGRTLIALVVADLTEQRLFERLAEAERALKEEAGRKDDFLAMLGHELRNPLVPIGNAVYLIRKVKDDPVLIEPACAIVERQVAHLSRLVEDLLDVSRIARGKILLRKEPLDLAAKVRLVLEDHQPSLAERRLELVADLPPGPVPMEADPARIVQILANLLQNAIKFTDPGGRIGVSLRADPAGGYDLSVQDTGAGFPPGADRAIFEPFMQTRASRERANGGLGLGLALVKGLVELHGGSVSACSEGPGRGAEFSVRMPVAAGPPEPVPPPAARARAPFRPRRILIIEDLVDSATTLQLLLRLLGHQVEAVLDGEAGLARAGRQAPDVLVCDIGLPGRLSGYDVARIFRSDPRLAGTRLIALTGLATPEDKARAAEAGFDVHLTKPVDPATWEAILASLPATPPARLPR